MGQDPDHIRQQIAETRDQLEQTVDAIGYKADVPARAKENVQGKVDTVTGKLGAAKDRIVGQAHGVADAAPSGHDLREGASSLTSSVGDTVGQGAETVKANARQAASVAQENPLGLAIGAAAVGFLGGMMIPSTRVEAERLGPMADQLRDQAMEAGQQAFDQGKQVAHDVADAASEAVAGATA